MTTTASCLRLESKLAHSFCFLSTDFMASRSLTVLLILTRRTLFPSCTLSTTYFCLHTFRFISDVGRTIEQAMADYIKVIAWAIEYFSLPVNSPIIAFGGSYPGDLVTYMRVAYPSVIDAGLASSAPLLYHAGMVPNGGFFRVCLLFRLANRRRSLLMTSHKKTKTALIWSGVHSLLYTRRPQQQLEEQRSPKSRWHCSYPSYELDCACVTH